MILWGKAGVHPPWDSPPPSGRDNSGELAPHPSSREQLPEASLHGCVWHVHTSKQSVAISHFPKLTAPDGL